MNIRLSKNKSGILLCDEQGTQVAKISISHVSNREEVIRYLEAKLASRNTQFPSLDDVQACNAKRTNIPFKDVSEIYHVIKTLGLWV